MFETTIRHFACRPVGVLSYPLPKARPVCMPFLNFFGELNESLSESLWVAVVRSDMRGALFGLEDF